jgi:hypothetical protein
VDVQQEDPHYFVSYFLCQEWWYLFVRKNGKRVEVFFTICSKSFLNINKLKMNCENKVGVCLAPCRFCLTSLVGVCPPPLLQADRFRNRFTSHPAVQSWTLLYSLSPPSSTLPRHYATLLSSCHDHLQALCWRSSGSKACRCESV